MYDTKETSLWIMFDARMYISYNHLAYRLLVFRRTIREHNICTSFHRLILSSMVISYELYMNMHLLKDFASWQWTVKSWGFILRLQESDIVPYSKLMAYAYYTSVSKFENFSCSVSFLCVCGVIGCATKVKWSRRTMIILLCQYCQLTVTVYCFFRLLNARNEAKVFKKLFEQ